jgi:hypothetical protein
LELLPGQLFELHYLEWPQLVLIFCGAAYFLTTLVTLKLRYSDLSDSVINIESRRLSWLALGFSLATIAAEYFLLRGGWNPRGASLL